MMRSVLFICLIVRDVFNLFILYFFLVEIIHSVRGETTHTEKLNEELRTHTPGFMLIISLLIIYKKTKQITCIGVPTASSPFWNVATKYVYTTYTS